MLRTVQSFDLNLLPIAHALLSERSVTRAAARLHLSVPAASRALDRCRSTFDDPLLVRAGRTLRITPRGAELLPEIEAALAAIERALRRPDEFDPSRHRGEYTVRTNEAILAVLAGPWLEIVAAQAPGIVLRFESEAVDDVEMLRRGDVSLVIGSYSGLTDDVHHELLVEEQLIGVLRSGHPLAGARITPKRYATLHHVVTSRRGIARGPVDDLLGQAGLRREIAAVVPTFAAAIGMCLSSDLTTLAPARLAHVLGGPSTMCTFTPPFVLPRVGVELLWHARHHHDPAHRWLRATVHEAVARAEHRVEADG
jgi:DNA-binding transcriptional LysR family regulator